MHSTLETPASHTSKVRKVILQQNADRLQLTEVVARAAVEPGVLVPVVVPDDDDGTLVAATAPPKADNVVQREEDGAGCGGGVFGCPWKNVELP